jgi:hypothetical protein
MKKAAQKPKKVNKPEESNSIQSQQLDNTFESINA